MPLLVEFPSTHLLAGEAPPTNTADANSDYDDDQPTTTVHFAKFSEVQWFEPDHEEEDRDKIWYTVEDKVRRRRDILHTERDR